MSGDPRVVFVGHDASRTGAPTVLLSFVSWLSRSTTTSTAVVLQRGGPLTAEFDDVVPTTVLDHGPGHVVRQATAGLRAVRPSLPRRVEATVAGPHLGRLGADVIVVNTLAALAPTVLAAPARIPIVCHVHELDGVADRVLPPAGPDRDRLLARVTRFVGAGPAVGTMLIDRWQIPAGRVVVIDEFIDPPAATARHGHRTRAGLGIGDDELLIVGAGAAGPRKGTDYFIELATALADHPGRPHFAWAGGAPDGPAWAEAAHDIAAAGLTGQVRMLGPLPDTAPLMAAADLLVSTAREDPFPLVALEAGAAGTALAGFASGGITAIAAGGDLESSIAPVGDVLGLARRVAALLDDRAARDQYGARLSDWVRSTHLTEHLAPVLWQAIVEVA